MGFFSNKSWWKDKKVGWPGRGVGDVLKHLNSITLKEIVQLQLRCWNGVSDFRGNSVPVEGHPDLMK